MYDDDPTKGEMIPEDDEDEDEDEIEVGSENGEMMMMGDFGVMDLRREMSGGGGGGERSGAMMSFADEARADLAAARGRHLDLSGSANRRAELSKLANRRSDFGEPATGLDLTRVTLESAMNSGLYNKDKLLAENSESENLRKRIHDATARLRQAQSLQLADSDDDDDDIDLENDDDDVNMSIEGSSSDYKSHQSVTERGHAGSSVPSVSTCGSFAAAKTRDRNGNEEDKALDVNSESSDDTIDIN